MRRILNLANVLVADSFKLLDTKAPGSCMRLEKQIIAVGPMRATLLLTVLRSRRAGVKGSCAAMHSGRGRGGGGGSNVTNAQGQGQQSHAQP